MTHQEEHHQRHRKDREERKEERKRQEDVAERSPVKIHPAWYLAVGLVLTLLATLIWTFFYARPF